MDLFTLILILLVGVLYAGMIVGSGWTSLKLLSHRGEDGQRKKITVMLGACLLLGAIYGGWLSYQFLFGK